MNFERIDPDAVEAIYAMCRVLIGTLAASMLVAVSALVLFEVSHSSLRRWIQLACFRRWERDRSTSKEIDPPSSKEIDPPSNLPAWVRQALENTGRSSVEVFEQIKRAWKLSGTGDPWFYVETIGNRSNELFMREVQLAAQAVIEHPMRNISLFRRLASFASEEEIDTLLILDALRINNPELFAELLSRGEPSEEPTPASAAIASAQDSIARSLERKLDSLQLNLAEKWKAWSRVVYVALSLAIAIAAPLLELGSKVFDTPTFIAIVGIGLSGGLIAVAFEGLASMIWWRRSQ